MVLSIVGPLTEATMPAGDAPGAALRRVGVAGAEAQTARGGREPLRAFKRRRSRAFVGFRRLRLRAASWRAPRPPRGRDRLESRRARLYALSWPRAKSYNVIGVLVTATAAYSALHSNRRDFPATKPF